MQTPSLRIPLRHIVAALLGLILFGCNNTPSLLGTWTSQYEGADLTLTFQKDDLMTGKGSMNGLTLDIGGKYSFDGHDLSITFTEAKPEAAEMNPLLMAAANQVKGFKQSGHLEWKNENEFILTTAKGVPVSFERQKAK